MNDFFPASSRRVLLDDSDSQGQKFNIMNEDALIKEQSVRTVDGTIVTEFPR